MAMFSCTVVEASRNSFKPIVPQVCSVWTGTSSLPICRVDGRCWEDGFQLQVARVHPQCKECTNLEVLDNSALALNINDAG
jgi:hypothetical protein